MIRLHPYNRQIILFDRWHIPYAPAYGWVNFLFRGMRNKFATEAEAALARPPLSPEARAFLKSGKAPRLDRDAVNDFYERDEAIEDIRAAWQAGEKGRTSGPRKLDEQAESVIDQTITKLEGDT